jgi:hypothetical protein
MAKRGRSANRSRRCLEQLEQIVEVRAYRCDQVINDGIRAAELLPLLLDLGLS